MKSFVSKTLCLLIFALPYVMFAQDDGEGPDPPPDDTPIDGYQLYLVLLGILLAFYFFKQGSLTTKTIDN